MSEEYLTMSNQEIERLTVIEKVHCKLLKQKKAALLLGITTRQIRILLKRYRTCGPAGLVSKRRGKPSNRAYSDDFKKEVVSLITDKYSDFGPTLAKEYVSEKHQITISTETTRQWMIGAGLWIPKREKNKVIHSPRVRRANYGELIQIDGSDHLWFEERNDRCSLLVFIDDATKRIQLMRFFPAETTFAYFHVLKLYLQRYGKPVALYSDKHGVFRVNIPEPKSGTGFTQFGRAMQELGIDLIYANSPQAKGRVERANGTLQDRLVKWMRIEKISDMATANERLDQFTADYNKRFAIPAREEEDVHRITEDMQEVESIFTHQEQRSVSKNLTLQYHNKIYQIKMPGKGYRLRQARVTVCEDESSKITLLYKNQSLNYVVTDKNQYYSEPVSAKELSVRLKKVPYKPDRNHPWRMAARLGVLKKQYQQHHHA